jgi:two-component system, LytTR family, response regulator
MEEQANEVHPMTKINAIIVDEERLARVNLRRLLEPFPEIEIAGEASSCSGAIELINLHNPQLIFLDIQLSGGTGFDLLELIDFSIKIIFVTAYDEYALAAFGMNAVDYLLKPVNPDRLIEAIGKVINDKTAAFNSLK